MHPALRTVVDSLQPVVDLIYPPRCPLCGEGLVTQDGLCSECWPQLVLPGDPSCARCQRPLDASSATQDTKCAPCLAAPPLHDGIAAATLYNDASRRLILSFKHGRRIALARLMAGLIAPRLARFEGDWLLVPVPLHPTRLWRRGFNQSVLLVEELGKRTGHDTAVTALRRKKRTPPLGGIGKKARARMLTGAIAATADGRRILKGRSVILVDDVMTSGATTTACIKALKNAGAAKVVIACFARVLDEAIPATQTKAPGAEAPGAT